MTSIEETVRQWIWQTQQSLDRDGKTPARLARLHTLEDVLMAIEEGASDA